MHWLLDPITKHYFDFSGRASRKEYWMFILSIVTVAILFSMLGGVLTGTSQVLALVVLGVQFAILIPSIAISVRRLHDVGISGWWFLISFIPLLGLILLFFFLKKGDVGPNRYGEDPYGATSPANEATDVLMQAIIQRVNMGYDDARIAEELQQAGYDAASTQGVIVQARANAPSVSTN